MTNRIIEEGENYLIYGNHADEARVLPKALLETIETANAFEEDVADALWFHRVLKNSPEYKWVKALDLLEVNLTGWELHFPESEGGYNRWNCVKLPVKVLHHENDYFEAVDALNQKTTLYIYQEDMVLMVKLTSEEHSSRLGKELEAFEEWRKRIAAMDAAQADLDAREKATNAPKEGETELDALFRVLLGP